MEAAKPSNNPLILRVGIVLLTAVTAAIHFSLLFPDVTFILNALGYIALLIALFAPVPGLEGRKPLVRWAFVGYTALTVLLWLLIGERSTIGYLTTTVELALIVLLLMERGRTRPGGKPSA